MEEDRTDLQNKTEEVHTLDAHIKKFRKSGAYLYLPRELVESDSFPFKDDDIVKLDVDSKGMTITARKPTESDLKEFVRSYLDDYLGGATTSAVQTTGAQFFQESNISMPQWWPSLTEYLDRNVPSKIAKGIKLAWEKQGKEEKAWTRRLQSFAEWLVGFVVTAVAGILIGWYMALHGFKVP